LQNDDQECDEVERSGRRMLMMWRDSHSHLFNSRMMCESVSIIIIIGRSSKKGFDERDERIGVKYSSMKVAPLTMAAWLAVSNGSAGIAAFTPYHSAVLHGSFVRRRVRCQSTPQFDSEPAIPRQEAVNKKGAFVNDGPLAWMTTYLDQFGLKEGKSVFFGALAIDVDDSKRSSQEEAAALRQKSAQDLTNIGMDERERRDKAGNVMWAVSAAYVVWASLIADDGGLSGHFLRFLSVIPLFLAVGYKLSAKTGL
jgi:hypothetical protein